MMEIVQSSAVTRGVNPLLSMITGHPQFLALWCPRICGHPQIHCIVIGVENKFTENSDVNAYSL